MLNAEPFEPLKIGKYTVIRVRFDFPNDSDLKMFVVLNHVTSGKNPYCKCIKTTSKTSLSESTPEMLASCVLYKAGEISFFPQKTAINPENNFNIAHEHFERNAKRHEYRVEGKMPDDFHGRLVSAIKNSALLNQREAEELLAAIGEKS